MVVYLADARAAIQTLSTCRCGNFEQECGQIEHSSGLARFQTTKRSSHTGLSLTRLQFAACFIFVWCSFLSVLPLKVLVGFTDCRPKVQHTDTGALRLVFCSMLCALLLADTLRHPPFNFHKNEYRTQWYSLRLNVSLSFGPRKNKI